MKCVIKIRNIVQNIEKEYRGYSGGCLEWFSQLYSKKKKKTIKCTFQIQLQNSHSTKTKKESLIVTENLPSITFI